MKLRLLKASIYFLVLVILSEVALRVFLDNASRLVYVEDSFCEYKLVPNQNIHRFHKKIQTNEYGMRSISVQKSQKRRILLFGDSVLNGGSKVDQPDLINYILDESLSAKYAVEIASFNISAGSWGPENAYRYLENYVDFSYDLIILLFNSHDYHDNMHFRKVVGEEPAWPSDQPYLALTDLFSGYIFPEVNSWFGSKYDYLDGFDNSAVNPGWKLFFENSKNTNIPLFVYHHPDTEELKNKQFSKEGVLLDSLCKFYDINLINGIEVESESDYIDNIHIGQTGNEKIAKILFEYISKNDLLKLNVKSE